MDKIAVIGGARFTSLKNLVITHSTTVKTPYGEPSAPLSYGLIGDREVVYLPRRGSQKPMAPHKINYRANIWALRDAGIQTIIATATVATLVSDFKVGEVIMPSQLIDYTYGRENTFLGEDATVSHISFADPYSEPLRQAIVQAAKLKSYFIQSHATYGIVQGPRLETNAETVRYAQDGCHLVGMTGMPEAALARELGLDYACLALVVRQGGRCVTEQQNEVIEKGNAQVEALVESIILSVN